VTDQETISIPHDFLTWRSGVNGLTAIRLLEDRVYCTSPAPGQVSLTISEATGESVRVVLSQEAALHLATLLTSAAGESRHEVPEAAGD